jgi:hypothetical protein
MYKYELYCGIGQDHSYEDLKNLVINAVNCINVAKFIFEQASYLDLNITIIDTLGSWSSKQNGLITEQGILITVFGDETIRVSVKKLGSIYKQKFKQESLLFTETELNYEFL